MKSILLSLVLGLMVLSYAPSQAATWENVGGNKIAVTYVDVDSIRRSPQETAMGFVKMDYLDKKEGADYAVGFMEFNCVEKRVRLLSVKATDTSKNVENLPVNSFWAPAGSDKLMNSIMTLICDWHPTK